MDEATLRRQVRPVIAAHPRAGGEARSGPALLGAGDDDEAAVEAARRYLKALAAIGWSVPGWPEAFGGRPPAERRVFMDEARRLRPVDLYPFGPAIHLVAPALMEFGSQDQQARWLPQVRAGDAIWCQLFSEPGAGSDLASASTRAVRSGDGWRVTGQKIWSSRAAYADWGLLLARTERSEPRHAGLTMFVVNMRAPGVAARRIQQMNGDRHFCQVFLDDVFVPDEDRIGEVGAGWKIATAVLRWERAGDPLSTNLSPRAVFNDLVELARGQGRLSDPLVRDRLMQLYIASRAAALAARAAERSPGGFPTSGGSGTKLRITWVMKDMGAMAMDLLGPEALLAGDDHPWSRYVLTIPSLSIRGGTDEIQRNIIAERVLGLPRE